MSTNFNPLPVGISIAPIIWTLDGMHSSNYDILIQEHYLWNNSTRFYKTYYRQLRFGSFHRSIEDAQQACWEYIQRSLVIDDFIKKIENAPDTAAVGQTPDPVPAAVVLGPYKTHTEAAAAAHSRHQRHDTGEDLTTQHLYDMKWVKESEHTFESCHGYDVIAPVIRREGVADKIISGCWYTFYEGVRFGPRYHAAAYAKEACRLHHVLSYCSERDTATAVVMKVLNPTLPPSPTIDPTIDIPNPVLRPQ